MELRVKPKELSRLRDSLKESSNSTAVIAALGIG